MQWHCLPFMQCLLKQTESSAGSLFWVYLSFNVAVGMLGIHTSDHQMARIDSNGFIQSHTYKVG